MRFRLRTLLILLAVMPPLLAVVWFSRRWIPLMTAMAFSGSLFLIAYWAILQGQGRNPRTRGSGDDYPIYPPPT